jgi:hypothetical protein
MISRLFRFLAIAAVLALGQNSARAGFNLDFVGTPGSPNMSLSLSGTATTTGGGASGTVVDFNFPNFITGSIGQMSLTGTLQVTVNSSATYSIAALSIDDLGARDRFTLFLSPSFSVANGSTVALSGSATFTLPNPTTFDIIAPGSYTQSSLDFDFPAYTSPSTFTWTSAGAPPTPTAAAPAPAGLILVLSGLPVLGVVRRFRRGSAAAV